MESIYSAYTRHLQRQTKPRNKAFRIRRPAALSTKILSLHPCLLFVLSVYQLQAYKAVCLSCHELELTEYIILRHTKVWKNAHLHVSLHMLIYLQAVIKNLLSIFCRCPSKVKLSIYILQNTSSSPTHSSKNKRSLAGKLPLFSILHIFCFVCF